jgi:hypothetical protein
LCPDRPRQRKRGPTVASMQIDDPLASPWSVARRICLWAVGVSWVVFFVNLWTTRFDWISEAILPVPVLALLVLIPVHLLGSRKLERLNRTAEQRAKELDRLSHRPTEPSS